MYEKPIAQPQFANLWYSNSHFHLEWHHQRIRAAELRNVNVVSTTFGAI
jgi:hypothetical protein